MLPLKAVIGSVLLFERIWWDGFRHQRDPRFVNRCGSFREHKFRSDFAFLYDDKLPAEALELKQRLKVRDRVHIF